MQKYLTKKIDIKSLISHQTTLENATQLLNEINERRSKESKLKNYNKQIFI